MNESIASSSNLREAKLPVFPSGIKPGWILFICSLWIGVVTLSSLAANWFIVQGLIEGSLRHDSGRWMINLAAGVLIALPFGLLSFLNIGIFKKVFKGWSLAGMVVILMTPTRMLSITNSQGVQVIQLVVLVIFSGCFAWLSKYGRSRASNSGSLKEHRSASGAVIIALVSVTPWILYGALGSWLDTLLGLAVGLAAGVLIHLIVDFFWSDIWVVLRSGHNGMNGLYVAQVLVIFCAAMGLNGNEWVFPITLPILGWLSVNWLGDNHLMRNGFVWLIGLAFAFPLIFVDPDELALIITFGKGELMERVMIAAVLSALLALLLILTMLISRKVVRFHTVSSKWTGRGLVLTLVALSAVDIWIGTPGFFGEKLFVILKNQADVSTISGTMDYQQRREAVYRALVEHAELTQKSLRQDLDRIGLSYTPYYLVNGLEVEAGPIIRLWLSRHPAVDRILDNPILRPIPTAVDDFNPTSQSKPESPPWNIIMIQADHVWNELGFRGEGIIIGQSDSGVQGDHPELANQYAGAEENNDYTWYDPWFGSTRPVDYEGHGTHTLGSILGSRVGVAPEARWIGCVNLARNLGNMAYYLDCLQFMLAPFPQNGDPFKDGDPSRGAHILNNSWGCPAVEGCDAQSMLAAFQALRKAGVFVVASAGNSGVSGCGSVDSPPAIYQEVYTAGSIDSNGERSLFSSVGPVRVDGSLRSKPDVLAPGQGILSAFPVNGYNILSGTSMSGPHVAGVVALMWSANPALIGDVDLTTSLINKSTREFTGFAINCDYGVDLKPSNISGYGILDAYGAVRAALRLPE